MSIIKKLRKQDLALLLGAIVLYAVLYFLMENRFIPSFWRLQIILIGINIILAASLNLINGITGQFSLGHAGFMAVGAYVSAIMTMWFGLPFGAALIIGGLAACLIGILIGIPTLRLDGDYLAIATLGMGEIIRICILNIPAVGGASGLTGIPRLTTFTWVFWVMIITLFFLKNLINSTYGRAFKAIRDDEVAAEAMGVNLSRHKMMSFVVSSFFAGIGAGSQRGILFKGGQSMEAMSKIKAVIMDKTGTITKGDFTVQKIVGGDELLELCADCEQQSTHPIAESIVAAAKARNMELRRPEELEELAGRGIRAKLDGKEILCGNERLLTEKGVSFPKSREYGTKVLVAVDGVYQGYLLIADTIKTGAENAVRALRDSGIETVMLTGDVKAVGEAVAREIGIDEVHAELLPGDKVDQVERLLKNTSGKGKLAFVGDGINDAPVLSRADIGIAMGGLGSDAAIEAADIVLMDDKPSKLAVAVRISRKTLRIVRQNIVFALGIKLLFLALGAFGMANMWEAVFADVGVSVLAILNASRALRTSGQEVPEPSVPVALQEGNG